MQIQRELQLHQFFWHQEMARKNPDMTGWQWMLSACVLLKDVSSSCALLKKKSLWIPCWKGDNGCTNLAWNGLLSPSCMQLSGSILLCAWIGCLWLHLQKGKDWWQASAGLLQSIFTYGFHKTLYSTGKDIHSKTCSAPQAPHLSLQELQLLH